MAIWDGIIDAAKGVIGGITPGVASLITGGLGFLGAGQQQDFNASQAQQAQGFSAEQASKQMDFQREMANTAMNFSAGQAANQMNFQTHNAATQWQRGVADMKAAGLNPMLAYSQGGNASMQGAAAQGVSATGASGQGFAAQGINRYAAGLNNAQTVANLDLAMAQADKTRAEANLTRSYMKEPGAKRDIWGDEDTKSFPAAAEQTRRRFLHNQAANEEEKYRLTMSQKTLVDQEIQNAIEENRRIKAATRDVTANAILRELAQAEAENQSKAQRKYSDYFQNVAPFTGEAGKMIHSAAEAFNIRKPRYSLTGR